MKIKFYEKQSSVPHLDFQPINLYFDFSGSRTGGSVLTCTVSCFAAAGGAVC